MNIERERKDLSSTTVTTSNGLSLRQLIASDLASMAALKGGTWPSIPAAADVLSLPGTWATIFVRLMNFFHARHLKVFSRILYFANTVLFSCEIQPGIDIGPGFTLPHPIAVGIAKGAVVGSGVHIMAMVRVGGLASDDQSLDGYPTIGDNCWLLDGAKVFGPCELGADTVVAANTLVTKSFTEGNVILVGSPARIARTRD